MDNYNNMDNRIKEKDNAYKSGLITGLLMGMAIFLLLLVGANIVTKYVDNKQNEDGQTLENIDSVSEKIKRIESYLDKYYMEDIDEETLVDGLYYGMTASLGDPYTGYYNEEEYTKMTESSDGEYCGIGVIVRQDSESGDIYVSRVYTNSPAMEAGVKEGDVIYSVNDTMLEGMSSDELVSLIVGKENTEFTMSVKRDGEILDFNLVRRNITVDTVSYEMKANNTGYIKIEEFDGVTTEQVRNAIDDLQSRGMTGIIIDLRDNPGGRLDTLKDIASMFLPKNELVIYSETKDGKKTEYYTENEAILPDMPMVILVNEESASAAEAFSGAMQCYDRAEIVGTTTFGKGIMQSIFPLGDGTALKITIGKYYLPDGNNIHKKGITPDYEVEDSEDGMSDPQLDKALELLNGH